LLRPSVANAPGPRDRTYLSPSMGQILSEAIALSAIPGGAFKLAGRVGFGFLGSMAVSGAATTVSLRGVSDAASGSLSSPLLYLFDADTGAVIGFVVPGGVRLIGQSGTQALDSLATYGLRKSDIALTRILAQEASPSPLTAAREQQFLQTRGMGGQISEWWLNRRGVTLLYRSQGQATSRILSPLAREQGVAASEQMVTKLRTVGRLSDTEIAGYTARWHTQGVPGALAPPGMAGQPLGSVGIWKTSSPF